MRELIYFGSGDGNPYERLVNATVALLLLAWGFTAHDGHEANIAYYDAFVSSRHPNPVSERNGAHLKKGRAAQDRLVTQRAAIDGVITDDENEFIVAFRHSLGFRMPEVEELLTRGEDIALHLSYIGKTFAEAGGARSVRQPSPV